MRSKRFRGASAAGLALALVLTGCGRAESEGSASSVKIAYLTTLSGAYASIGRAYVRGAELGVAELNESGGINGKDVELLVEDDQADAQVASRKMTELSSEGVRFVAGMLSSPVCLAAGQAGESLGMIVMGGGCSVDELTGSDLTDNFFRAHPTDSQMQFANAQLVAQVMPAVKRWSVFGPDYSQPRSAWTSFQRHMEDGGHSVIAEEEVFHPLDATDLAPYIVKLTRKAHGEDDQGLLASASGAYFTNLLKQGASSDLGGKFKNVVVAGTIDDALQTAAQDLVPLWNTYFYAHGAYDNERAKHFEERFTKAYPGEVPTANDAVGYLSLTALAEGLRQAKSTDVDDVREALEGLEMDTLIGHLSMGANHQMSSTMVARRVERAANDRGYRVTQVIQIEVPADIASGTE